MSYTITFTCNECALEEEMQVAGNVAFAGSRQIYGICSDCEREHKRLEALAEDSARA